MPGDDFHKPLSGQRIQQFPARLMSGMIDAAHALKAETTTATDGRSPEGLDQADVVLVRNDSTVTIPRFGVIGVNGVAILPGDNLLEFQRLVVLAGVVPTTASHAGKFVVTLEPILAGAIGRAVASGLVAVLTTGTGSYADVTNNDATQLTLGNSGAQILFRDASTGWSVIRMGAAVGLAGDVTGATSATRVVALRNIPLCTTIPTVGQVNTFTLLPAPTGLTSTLTTGGALPSGTAQYYVITATNAAGETPKATETTKTPTGSTLSVSLAWSAEAFASGYKVYRSTVSGTYTGSHLLATITDPTVLTFKDDGSASLTTGAPPATGTAGEWCPATPSGGGGGTTFKGASISQPTLFLSTSYTQVTFSTTDFDAGGFTGTANQLTVPTTGYYLLGFSGLHAQGGTTDNVLIGYCLKNGTTQVQPQDQAFYSTAQGKTNLSGSAILPLTAGDNLQILAATLNTANSLAILAGTFWIQFIGN